MVVVGNSIRDAMTPQRTGHRILIVASDPILAALVGALVEFARYTAAFPGPDEAPDQALERVKPLAAVLLDAGDPRNASDLFVSRAERLSVRVFLFGRRELVSAHAEWASRLRMRVFALPEEIADLENALEALMPEAPHSRTQRDRRGEAHRAPNGTLDFTDTRGVHWTVFDRRGPERRNSVDRRFVNDQGQVRHCEITEQEARLVSVATLEAQLERSVER